MRVAIVHRDDSVPQTHLHRAFIRSLVGNRRFTDQLGDPNIVLFAAEECTPSLNWPGFGDPRAAFVRGRLCDEDLARFSQYLCSFLGLGGIKCVLNTMPGMPLAAVQRRPDIIVADINLLGPYRAANANTISMPTLPITAGRGGTGRKDVLASFRGYRSHPIRDRLGRLHDGREVVCELLDTQYYRGKISAATGRHDPKYQGLMQRSVFAFVPRGDANFSIRLLEAMSFGCIPVVLSDGWVLPFDRTVDWSGLSLHVPEAEIEQAVARLRALPASRIAAMQSAVAAVYAEKFASLDHVTEGLLQEVELLFASAMQALAA